MIAHHGISKNNKHHWLQLILRSSRSRKLTCFFLTLISMLSSYLPADDALTLQPDASFSSTITINSTESIRLNIDTKALESDLHGKIPIKFYSEDSNVSFTNDGKENSELFWHKNNISFTENGESVQTLNDELINFRFTPTEDMVGKKLSFVVEKEENLSKAAAVGALIPQMLPPAIMEAFDTSVQWAPHGFWTNALHWNFLLLELDIIRSVKELIKHQIFQEDYSSRFAQCSADLIEGFIIYNAANHHHNPFTMTELGDGLKDASHTNRVDAFRTYLRSTPTNRMLDCISGTVGDLLKEIHQKGKSREVFGNWSYLNTLNDKTLEGVAKLMVGYGFNLFVNEPSRLLLNIRAKVGLEHYRNLGPAITNSLRTSIQYTIHNGYMTFFKGRGWSNTTAYALASGAGAIEIGYRLYQINSLNVGRTWTPNRNQKLEQNAHHLSSIGERSEAIISSSFDLIPISKNTLKHTVTAAGVTLGAWVVFSAAVQSGWLNSTVPQGLNSGIQKVITSGANGLVLGALSYVLLPYIQKISGNASQLVADQLVSHTRASKNSWIGYFAARDTQYKVHVSIME